SGSPRIRQADALKPASVRDGYNPSPVHRESGAERFHGNYKNGRRDAVSMNRGGFPEYSAAHATSPSPRAFPSMPHQTIDRHDSQVSAPPYGDAIQNASHKDRSSAALHRCAG